MTNDFHSLRYRNTWPLGYWELWRSLDVCLLVRESVGFVAINGGNDHSWPSIILLPLDFDWFGAFLLLVFIQPISHWALSSPWWHRTLIKYLFSKADVGYIYMLADMNFKDPSQVVFRLSKFPQVEQSLCANECTDREIMVSSSDLTFTYIM